MSKPRAGLAHAAHGDARPRSRSSISTPLRRLAAAVTALVLGGGLALVGVAAPASAHTGDLKASAVCNVETGEYDVTYTLKLSNVPTGKTGTTMWEVGGSRFEGTPKSADGMDRGPLSSTGNATLELGTESLPGDTVGNGPWVYAFTSWDRNNKKGSDGRIEGLNGDCGNETTVKKITFCHATGSATNPYVRLTTSVSAFLNAGHIDHQKRGDIYPEFTYKKPGKNGQLITVPAQGDQSLLTTGDCTKPGPTEIEVEGAPSFADTCGPDNEKLTVPADTKFIDWEKREQNGVITVTATANTGYVFKPGAKTEWTFTIDDAPCPPTEVPVGGEPTFSDTCGVDNEKLTVPADTDFVDWNHSESNGVITVTATAKKDYVFPKDAQTEWTFTIDDSDCIVEVVGAPTFSDTCGVDNEKLTVPDDTKFIDWEQNEVGGVITVTATPQKGFAFPKDAQTEWTYTIDDEPCVVEVEGEPRFEDTCGPDNEKLTLPDDTDTIDWEWIEEDGVITVTATALEGSVFPEGAQATWTFTIDDLPCVIELTGEPTLSDVCGPDNEKVSHPGDTDLVTWAQSEKDGVVTVTATAAPGNTFPQGPVVVWTYTLDDEPCIAPVLEGSVATGVCEADAPWISYKVVLTDPDAQSTSREVSLVLSDGEHTETIELGTVGEDGVLEGRVLWPGASVDEEGNATGWPGWKQLGDGTWVQTDDNFAWTRNLTSATFVVNPELAVELAYPPATPDCIAAPPTPETPGEPGGNGDTPSTPAGDGLASTGFAGTTIAIVAGVVVLAGIAFLVIARLRRKQS
ncbi:hypothetical protein [Agromyces lapidis]|uniref:Gram-positive cocci surface proteins LPxTG domain-containing protein n=1 Tax=Agromyces lapidis TaxID=279574 RepID=A0ABV5SQR2_9MICO|nr:hypothetical protein [Agromyces lapidis]